MGGETSANVRPFLDTDLDAAADLSAVVDWPHRREDWAFLLSLGQGVVAVSEGVVVGTAMAWLYGDDAASIGMIIVDPRRRRGGIGRRLTATGLDVAAQRTVMLYATRAGASLYRGMGFGDVGSARHWQGVVGDGALHDDASPATVREAGLSDRDALARLDHGAFGAAREHVLEAVMRDLSCVVADGSEGPVGYASCRRFGLGWVVGPVVAPDRPTAASLVAHWLEAHRGDFLRIDLTGDAGLGDWLGTWGLKPADEVVLMRRGAPLETGTVRRFALLSQATG